AQRPDEDSLCHRDFIVTLESVYNFEPVPEWIAPSVATNILGGQGSMWTEYYPTVARLEYALFPRISAISEVYWSQKKNRDFTRFKAKLRKQFERYELWGTNYSKYD
ncbi:MAG: family 20 glycosylhydrolase, partial [Bacteroidales bacterium]|nr:family 20 glycosylhydrolase [Bacteroidales bacterium]